MLARASAASAASEIIATEQQNIIIGGKGADWLTGIAKGFDCPLGNVIRGGMGDDHLQAATIATGHVASSALNDVMGGRGNDTIEVYSECPLSVRSNVRGGLGNDTISVWQTGTDFSTRNIAAVNGGAGNDLIDIHLEAMGAVRYDPLIRAEGGSGSDRLTAVFLGDGASMTTTLSGGNGRDVLSAYTDGTGDVRHVLAGGAGNDVLKSELERDGGSVLTGGRGNDTIVLEGGADVFRFGKGHGRDVVTGWDLSEDQLALGSLQPGEAVVTDDGVDVVIAFGADTIRFVGIGDGTHDLSDFLLA